ncbi:hypothetical protein JL720_10606 [Aureococcus anophagefferens]|nr:hypothetical protein JL720_10606 [Aureococcus anophagefferens]
MDGDVADLAAWRRRVDGELASLRQSRDDARRAHDELAEDVRRLLKRLFGGEGGGGYDGGELVQSAQLQAHAAVSAAIAPVQAHLERELSVVRRHVAALRSGGSFDNVLPGDVEDALAADRPSELLVKGVVASACADVEATLEKKLTTVLSARVALDLEAKAKDVQRDAEDRVFARARRRRGRALGPGCSRASARARSARAAGPSARRRRTRRRRARRPSTPPSRRRGSTPRLAELRDDLEGAGRRAERDQRSAAVEAARADLTKQAVAAMARATEARDAVASCQSFVDAAEARRARGDRERSEVLQKVAVYADEARVDAPAVRRAAAAGARIDAAEEQLLKLETRLGNVLEAWRDEHGGGGAEGAIKKLGDADETARKVSRDVARRVSALEEQLEPLQRHARRPRAAWRCERDVADAAARADALAKNVDKQALAHRAAVNAASRPPTAPPKLAGRADDFSEAVNGARNLRIRVDALEADHGELRATAVRAVAKGALGRTERVLVELDAVARRVDDLAADVKTSATLAARAAARAAAPGAAGAGAARRPRATTPTPTSLPSTKKRSPVASLGLPSPAPSSDWDASLPAPPAPADRGARARGAGPARRGFSPESIREEEGVDDDEAPAKAFLTAQPTPTPPSPKSPGLRRRDGGGEPTMTLSFGGGGDSSGDETPPEAAPAAEPVDFRSRFRSRFSSGLDAQKSVVGTEKESDDDDFDDDYGTSDSDA